MSEGSNEKVAKGARSKTHLIIGVEHKCGVAVQLLQIIGVVPVGGVGMIQLGGILHSLPLGLRVMEQSSGPPDVLGGDVLPHLPL